MALVLNRQLASTTAAVVDGCCYRLAGTRGKSGLVGERLSASVWRMRGLTQVSRRGAQQQMRTNASSVTQQTRSDSNSPLLETSCGAHLSAAKVFEDEAKGICCYRSPSGEVTCEGYDEGPHLEPEKHCERTSVNCDAAPMQDVFAYKYVTGGQGKAYCEGKDES